MNSPSNPSADPLRQGGAPDPLGAFTLIELLVVIGIIGVMMSLLIPAFGNIGKGSSLGMSGNQVANILNLARENSTSRNAMTAVVLNTDTTTDTNPLTNGAYRTLIVMERLAPETGVTPSPNDWKPVGKWEELRQGVVVVTSSNATTGKEIGPLMPTDNIKPDAPTPALPDFNYRTKPVKLKDCPYVIFLPNGSLYSGKATKITLAEGLFQGSSAIKTNKGNYYDITILPSTGRTKIDRP